MLLTVAIVGALLLHVPPETEPVSVDVEPTHIAVAPVIVPAEPPDPTVIESAAVAVPQLLVTV